MEIKFPELSLVVLIGPSGSGKSTFARRHFKPTEIVSSDHCRALVSDDENNQAASKDAFELLHNLVDIRLRRGLLTVVDATHVQPPARRELLEIAKRNHVFAAAIVFKLPERVCIERNALRTDRSIGPHVVRHQYAQLRKAMGDLKREGFRPIYFLGSEEEVNAATIVREPLWCNRHKAETGPFDIIGDVHGCYDELLELLGGLGYKVTEDASLAESYGIRVSHPAGRRLVFVGDLVDRGPRTPDVLRLVMSAVKDRIGYAVVGNHDDKLLRHMKGKNVQVKNGLEQSVEQLAACTEEFRQQAQRFLESLIAHHVLDEGKLIVAHAGLKEKMHGRGSAAIRDFAMYGDTTGEIDEFGLPVRLKWATDYKGQALVVYGHTPVFEPEWLNNTVNIDTGCVFGHKLTALRYPERELVSVPARQEYAEAKRPILSAGNDRSTQQAHDDLLDVQDVLGKQVIQTGFGNTVLIQEAESLAAFEIMNRWAVNPKWLIYLPPTMSPTEASELPDYLEYPAEAFAYFRKMGVEQVVCEEKHMGSRAIAIICKDEEAALRAFGVQGEGIGVIYTRTGRAFFSEKADEQALLLRVRDAFSRAGFWEKFETDWVCLDCELLPWSAKAQGLLKGQYASVGVSGTTALRAAGGYLQMAAARSVPVQEVETRVGERLAQLESYQEAYRRYCWPVNGIEDYRLAPFHILAVEGRHFCHETHQWHMEKIHAFCAAGQEPILKATDYHVINLADAVQEEAVTDWWLGLTQAGGEGMVVKPMEYTRRAEDGKLVQPALKVRGPEYLRIIYGAEYRLPHNMERLRVRKVGGKRALAQREFMLGIEGLERFLRKEPLRRVHQCVFGVLALETEPVDPRL